MPDLWLPLEDRLALWDPAAEQLRVVGWRPGPAGVSPVDVADGLRVVVDHASPTTLTELTVVHDRNGRVPDDLLDLVAHLLGEEATTALIELPRRRHDDRPTPLRATADRDRPRIDPGATDRARTFARLALGADLADDANLSDTARAVALLESARAGVDVHHPYALATARHALDLLAAAGGPADLTQSSLAPDTLAEAIDVVLGRVRRDHEVRRDRRRLAGPARFAAAAAAPTAAPLAAAMDELSAFESRKAAAGAAEPKPPAGEPTEVDGDLRGWAWRDDGNNVRIAAARNTAGTWARVFRRHDRLLLGLAPMRADGSNDANQLDALVVIPPVDDAADLVVDIVRDPSTLRPRRDHDLLHQAVTTARRAARLTRLGDPDADHVWSTCERLWHALGDEQRANLAARHGRRDDDRQAIGRSARPTPETAPLLADELD